MSFLDEVRAKRQKLADVLSDEEYSGIRKVVENLYPDRAHFIYELLQNAEDTEATEATFELTANSVAFEHNGRPFDKNDVWAITNIGKGAKEDQDDKIGRFGIGFKAVFAYTETPHIWSRTYSFQISDLVLPTAIAERPGLGVKTRFEFPFNHPKKPAQAAYEEIKAELETLAETTLLFLSNLTCISWRISSELSSGIMREQHSGYHVEVLKEAGQKTTTSSHFLRFSAPVEDLPRQTVSIAFPLGFLPNVERFDPAKPISQQLKISVSTAGCVAVYFPAEKETSGLRFHLHAPFVPELSRASIKDTPANGPLFGQLARLAAVSLHTVRDLDLLTGEFLGVLPNPQDLIPPRYQPIRTAIIEEMKSELLTPTHKKSHAPAKELLQAKASLKNLLSDEDLQSLLVWRKNPQWAVGAPPGSPNWERFLDGLDITQWGLSKFVELLKRRLSESYPPFMNWLAAKPLEWHQQLYAFLNDELSWNEIRQLRPFSLVRLVDGNYSTGEKCYFPSDGVEHDRWLPRIDQRIYSSGRNTTQQTNARKFLEEIGVREVGEVEEVESILKQRYTAEAFHPELDDLERFVRLVEANPKNAAIFRTYYIFRLVTGKWGMPSQVFLDSPYLETGLSAYYEALGASATKWALAADDRQDPVSRARLGQFAEAVGVQTALEVREVSCDNNPECYYLWSVPGERYRSRIDRDYIIESLDKVLVSPTIGLSRLVWRTICGLPTRYLRACYQKNERRGPRYTSSQLVHLLKRSKWIPQRSGQSVEFISPAEASRELLPEGFPFNEGDEWLKAVRFGESEKQRSDERKRIQKIARELGFDNERALRDAQQFVKLFPYEERQRLLQDIERTQQFALPEHDPHNPDRRAERVGQQAANAPERISEKRARSVSVGLEEVKQKAEQYLRQQYTDADGTMICQVCETPLPFQLDDGSYYVEKVEFLSDLQKHHYQNYLALCPTHAAMYQHANGSCELMKEMFLAMEGNELAVVLAQKNATIYFTGTHAADLRAVIAADGSREPRTDKA